MSHHLTIQAHQGELAHVPMHHSFARRAGAQRSQGTCLPKFVPSLSAHRRWMLIMFDDLGHGDLGYQNSKHAITPHIDKMAESSLVFNRFYAAAPVCSPTRGSALTGRITLSDNRYKLVHYGKGQPFLIDS